MLLDVLINVFSKPYQTALSLLSLLKYSGDYINKIYFHQEPAFSEFERKDSSGLIHYLKDKVIVYHVPYWLSNFTIDENRLLVDENYRLSVRYQYGFENTDKKFVLIIHNDIEVIDDVIGKMLQEIGDATAIGEIGQCWWCPAGQTGLCSSENYTEFKPPYSQLMFIYNNDMDYTKRRAYNLGLRREFQKNPWPLPECRVNEWCMLVNVEKARPATIPFGDAAPIGAQVASGAKIGETWEDDVNLDTGVQWFRDLNHAGHIFKDFPIEDCIIHDRRGRVACGTPELYIKNEIEAKEKLRREYPDVYSKI
ncbi:MAG: hypothetical protein LBS65_11225 [Desulfovibrio sp.]|jgi:hypothetical protein|nr:hypothetical protein [Desulfovibrio sp.]